MLATVPWYHSPEKPLLVGHLMASAPPRDRAENAGSGALSLMLHAALLALAVWLTTGRPAQVLLSGTGPVELINPVVPLIAPEPPPPPTLAGAVMGGDVPPVWGHQVLTAPVNIPIDIPPIRQGPPTYEPDFSGEGPVNGRAGAARGAAPVAAADPLAHPGSFTVFTLAPELRNRSEVERALVHAYPPALRDAGITGRVLVWVLVDEEGQVMKAVVKATSGVPQLDEAALGVARSMRFSPGLNRDQKVKVWVAIPVDFRVGN